MTPDIVLRPTRRRWVRTPWVLLVVAILLGAGWSALWLLAQRQALQSMVTWLAAEAARGRPWSCPARDITGFPLSFILSCVGPTFALRTGGEMVQGQLAGLQAEASLIHPNSIRVNLASPMTARSGEDADPLEIAWSALSIDIGLTLAAGARVAVDVDGLDILRPDQPKVRVDHAALQLATDGLSGSSRRDYRVAAKLVGIAAPDLDDATGNSAPLNVEETATITALELRGLEPWHEVMERWRLASGTVEVAALTCGKGPMSVSARGQLALDDLHRPTGLLQTTVTGYEALAERLGLPLRAVSFGGALAGLLNGPAKTPPPGGDAGRGTITVPIGLNNGRLSVGPFKTGLRLAPLY